MELTEFLLARIAEDEGLARAVVESHASEDWESFVSSAGMYTSAASEFTARIDLPARVMAECEAKRRVVEDYEHLSADYSVTHDPTTEARRFQAAISMGRLASVYADHPDWREEWRP